ncbi:hypothetical protein [Bacillus weihaiensis]|nr:hypothetical protein [Bacillus weihaiensis]
MNKGCFYIVVAFQKKVPSAGFFSGVQGSSVCIGRAALGGMNDDYIL